MGGIFWETNNENGYRVVAIFIREIRRNKNRRFFIFLKLVIIRNTSADTIAIITLQVPEILLSGNHGKIDEYRYEERLYTTLIKRPDLFKRYINENKLDINKVNEIITKKEGN